MTSRIPILVLGGSDPRPGAVPQGMSPSQMLTGFKGAKLLPWGRCLAAELTDRIRQTDRFHEPLLIGPRRIYGDLVDVPVVDVEGSLATTLQQAIEAIRRRFCMSAPVAITTSDILPTAEEIWQLLDESYAPHHDSAFWGQLLAAEPAAMGVSSWKPSYYLGALQLPILTLSIPYYALVAFFKCRRRQATVADFERAVAKGFLHRKHLSDAHGRPVVFSVIRVFSFAKDIDTIAEFNEAAERGPGK